MLRILIAGVVGGALLFVTAAFARMVLNLGGPGRAIRYLPDEAAMAEFFAAQRIAPGIYGFPSVPENFAKLDAAAKEAEWTRLSEAYKKGPAAFIVVAPPGMEIMGPDKLGREFASNVAAAILVSWIVSQAAGAVYWMRWLICVVFAAASWVSLIASYQIWYRFSAAFVRDELYGSLLEWAVAGLAIAAIVSTEAPTKVSVKA